MQGGFAGEGVEEAEDLFGRLVERLGARLWGLRAWFFFGGKFVGWCVGVEETGEEGRVSGRSRDVTRRERSLRWEKHDNDG